MLPHLSSASEIALALMLLHLLNCYKRIWVPPRIPETNVSGARQLHANAQQSARNGVRWDRSALIVFNCRCLPACRPSKYRRRYPDTEPGEPVPGCELHPPELQHHDGHLCAVRARVTAARSGKDVGDGRVSLVKADCTGENRQYFSAVAIADGELASWKLFWSQLEPNRAGR